jgi:class 3 adenylate cyclase
MRGGVRFLLRWILINLACNASGFVVACVSLVVAGEASPGQLATVLGSLLCVLPFLPMLLAPLAAPRAARFVRTLARLEKGSVPAEELAWAQWFYFWGPRLVGLAALGIWALAGVGVYFLDAGRLEPALNRELLVIQAGFAGPVTAILTMLAGDAHMRSNARRLFPDGRLSHAPARALPVPVRMGLVITLGALLPLGLMAFVAHAFTRAVDPRAALVSLARTELFLLGVAILILIALGLITARAVGRPILGLISGTREVEKGNLDARVPVESNDLVGYMGERFNLMVDSLRERELIRQVFGRYVSEPVAKEILAGKLELGGERREASVLFSDIRGFTTLSENMEPRDVVLLLNRYFTRMVACVAAENGMVNKFLGDGMMAVFGAPLAQEDAALRAVRAALAMQAALAEFNREQRQAGGRELAIGVGIATGEVLVGNVGSADRAEYTAIGDVVNVASRIEGLTKEVGAPILIDEATRARVQTSLVCEAAGERAVKGRAAPVMVYRVGPHASGARELRALEPSS